MKGVSDTIKKAKTKTVLVELAEKCINQFMLTRAKQIAKQDNLKKEM